MTAAHGSSPATQLWPTRLVLLGHPVSHSLSPRMQSAALQAAGIDRTYEALDVLPGQFADVLRGLAQTHAGGNVTVPHKEAALRVCGRLTTVARQVGAVNTFWVEGDTLVGDNTDVGGFHNMVARLRGEVPTRARIGVIGAGGAAAAVLAAVASWPGCEARIWNRTPLRAAALAARFAAVTRPMPTLAEAIAGAAVVVNATTVGLTDDTVPVDVGALPPGADVIDLVYRPGGTRWVTAAQHAGHRACDGTAMLIEQGALAFERWFGRPADRRAMRAACGC